MRPSPMAPYPYSATAAAVAFRSTVAVKIDLTDHYPDLHIVLQNDARRCAQNEYHWPVWCMALDGEASGSNEQLGSMGRRCVGFTLIDIANVWVESVEMSDLAFVDWQRLLAPIYRVEGSTRSDAHLTNPLR